MKDGKESIRPTTWVIVGIAIIFIAGSFGSQLYYSAQEKRIEAEKGSKDQQELLLKQQEELAKTKKEIESLKNNSTNQDSIAEPANKNNGIVPINNILCNGIYWTPCPSGQNFYCPTTGSAQCIIENIQSNNTVTKSPQQECLAKGLQMVNEESSKYPSYSDLINQKNALLISLYPNSTRSSGEIATITPAENASLTASQKNAINSNNPTLIRTELDDVNVKLRVENDKISKLDDYLYMVRLVCGTVTTEQQMIYELQKIRESLDKLRN